jgi:Fur family peroxide stress response transcriptional regulator
MQNRDRARLFERFKEVCVKNNLKVTPQRFAIFRELTLPANHPSADTMYHSIREEFPNISLDTVNRTLLTFAEIGLACVVEGHGDPRRFDPNTEIHHHFHCRKCGTIIDVHDDKYDRLQIPDDIKEKYTVLNKRVVLDGICDKCRRKNNASSKKLLTIGMKGEKNE